MVFSYLSASFMVFSFFLVGTNLHVIGFFTLCQVSLLISLFVFVSRYLWRQLPQGLVPSLQAPFPVLSPDEVCGVRGRP